MFRKCYCLVLRLSFILLAVGFVPRAFGQFPNVTNNTATPTPGVGHDYLGMLNETVNPANGSLSVRISVPTPAGRGLSLPFAFEYDSNGVQNAEYQHGGTVATAGWVARNTFLHSAGWRYAVPTLSVYGKSSTCTYVNQQKATVNYWTDYTFQDPSGGRHALNVAFTDPTPGGCSTRTAALCP